MYKKRLGGFTLIEILIVMAVVAVLAAILMGVFARVREKARQASCQSNLKQIALGIQMYVQDNDSRYPSVQNWAEATLPYVGDKKKQVFRCPSEQVPLKGDLSFYNFHNRWFNTVTYTGNKVVYSGVNESAVLQPSENSLLSDSGFSDSVALPSGCASKFSEGLWLSQIHSSGSNYLFGDGHVKWLSTSERIKRECSSP